MTSSAIQNIKENSQNTATKARISIAQILGKNILWTGKVEVTYILIQLLVHDKINSPDNKNKRT